MGPGPPPGMSEWRIKVTLHTVGYALACVLVPVAWGLVVVWVSNRLDARILRHDRRTGHGRRRRPRPIEYHI
jgi:hypothetical protein